MKAIYLTTLFLLSLVLSACKDDMPASPNAVCTENYMPTNHKGWKYDKSAVAIQLKYMSNNSDRDCQVAIHDSNNRLISNNRILVKQNGDVFVNPFFLNNVLNDSESCRLPTYFNFKMVCILPCYGNSVAIYDSTFNSRIEVPCADSLGNEAWIVEKSSVILSYTTKRVSEQEEIYNGVATKVTTVSLNLDHHLTVVSELLSGKIPPPAIKKIPIISGTYVIKFAHNYGIISITRGDGATTKLLNLL